MQQIVMRGRTTILIDDNPDELDLLEAAIKEIDATASCTSFIYSDEAVRVIRE